MGFHVSVYLAVGSARPPAGKRPTGSSPGGSRRGASTTTRTARPVPSSRQCAPTSDQRRPQGHTDPDRAREPHLVGSLSGCRWVGCSHSAAPYAHPTVDHAVDLAGRAGGHGRGSDSAALGGVRALVSQPGPALSLFTQQASPRISACLPVGTAGCRTKPRPRLANRCRKSTANELSELLDCVAGSPLRATRVLGHRVRDTRRGEPRPAHEPQHRPEGRGCR